MIKESEHHSDKTFQYMEGTLYPVLHKLKRYGYVKSYQSKGDAGRKRK
ncbi:MAG: helix-turn-helix transcriptional regulator [Clostridia bacterium]|nr:helix-turn-helix transcriptional regulator [Clostridia bacterium]MDD4680886.1 helix-turn-helix transcriptional regulator [Clostridia bacterium]